MKNPMDRQLEKRLSERAVEIGREGNVAAFGDLLELLRCSSANGRRLAASALGKLAWMGVDQAVAVAALAPVARSDPHAQTRQYAIKALKAYGAAAKGCLSDLRDMATNPAEKDYIHRDAAAAVEFNTPQYKMSMYKKQTLYQQEGKRLISVYPSDLPRLGTLMSAKLKLFGFLVSIDERSEVSRAGSVE